MTPERLVVTHAAPTLAGVKCASLICLKGIAFSLDEVKSRLRLKGVGFRSYKTATGCPLLLAYRPWPLKTALEEEVARTHLEPLGYKVDDLSQCLDRLGSRLLDGPSFPHEVGFFLGYPCKDVAAFMATGGQGFVESGMWKIYHDVDEGRALCQSYRECTKRYLDALSLGCALEELCQSA